MSRYIVAFRFDDEDSADMYYRAANRFAIEREKAFVFSDRGAAEVIAAQTGGEVEELPEPTAPPSEIEMLMAHMHAGDIRDRIAAVVRVLEAKIVAEENGYDASAQSGNEYGCSHHRNRKEAYLYCLESIRRALR